MEKANKPTQNRNRILQMNTTLATTQPEKDKASTSSTIIATDYACKICTETFKSAQECFRHELLRHTSDRLRPKKAFRSKINAMLQIVMDNKRKELHEKLSASMPQRKLDAICQFYAMNKENFNIVYERILISLRRELRDQFTVHPFGSILSELALRDSDIDFYLKPMNNKIPPKRMYSFNKVESLLRHSACFEDIICIRHARVPIIKCKHSESGFSLDINISSSDSIMNSMFLRDLVRWDKRLHQILLFMKIWAKQLQIIGCGNMSSYCLITLVLFFLQQRNLLPSIKAMQARPPPNLINGINYAYNLNILKSWPEDVSGFYLIKEFFFFYQNFGFGNLLVSPYLGKAIPLTSLEDSFPEYKAQLEAVQAATGAAPEHFQVNRVVRVQDPFSLSHNIAKSISQNNIFHFLECVSNAVNICKNDKICNVGDIYERLLFDKIEELVMKQAPEAKISKKSDNIQDQHSQLTTSQPQQDKSKNVLLNSFLNKGLPAQTCRIIPSRAEIRELQNYFGMDKTILKNSVLYYWSFHYVQVMKELITEIFCIDLRSVSPERNDDQLQLTYIWDLTGTIDMWTGRTHQRSEGKSYLACQQAQTSIFRMERCQKPNFIIDLHGLLELHIDDQYNQINISLRGCDHNGRDLHRNSPLSRFFAAFKCALQNFKLKEKLEVRQHVNNETH